MSPRRPCRTDRSLTFYGDDFTGSSAVMEVTDLRGPADGSVPRARRRRSDSPGSRATAASASPASPARRIPAWMDRNLPPVFAAAAPALGAPIAHYKVCSTFDSAPHVGSIGRAIDIAAPHPRRRLAADRGGDPGDGPLPGLRQSVRGRERRRLPARPAPDHVAPSGHADGRGRSRPASRPADRATESASSTSSQ